MVDGERVPSDLTASFRARTAFVGNRRGLGEIGGDWHGCRKVPMADSGQAQGSLLDEALRSTTRAVASAPKVALLIVLVITGICVALTVCYLGFKTDRADLIDPNSAGSHIRRVSERGRMPSS